MVSILSCQAFIGLVLCGSVAAIPVDKPGYFKMDFNVNKRYVSKHSKRSVSAPLESYKYYYTIPLQFGSQQQTVGVDVDTGSSDLWVGPGTYDPSKSTSFVDSNIPFSIRYVSAYSRGTWVRDTVSVQGGPALPGFQFARVTDTNVSLPGVLGVSFADGEVADPQYPNFPAALKLAGYIFKAAFSIYLNDISTKSGAIIFGGIDNSKYEGSLVTLPIVPIKSKIPAIAVTLESVTTNGGNPYPLNLPAVLDTGTSLTTVPNDALESIAKNINGVKYVKDDGVIYLPSCALPEDQFVTFSFSGKDIEVPLSELPMQEDGEDCYLGIYSAEVYSRGQVYLGDTFLRSAYVVANLDDQIVQIAQAKYTSDSSIVAIM